MDIYETKRKFFEKHPNTYASFYFNEKLNRFVCFVFDYAGSNNKTQAISEELKQKINNYKCAEKDPFNKVLAYFTANGIKQQLLEKISDFYYTCILNDKKFKTTNDVCDALNTYLTSHRTFGPTESHKKDGLVSAYLVDEDGKLEKSNVFYMTLSYSTTSKGLKACKIENTFTDEEYYEKGLHTYGIKFLEAVLARKNVYTIIGESIDCNVHETKNHSSLNQHYQKLGFTIKTDMYGNSVIKKDVDPFNLMQITADDEFIK